MNKLLEPIKELFSDQMPPSDDENDAGQWWQAKIVRTLAGLAVLLSVVVYPPSLLLALYEGRLSVAAIDTLALAIIIYILLGKRLSTHAKASVMVWSTLSLGAGLLYLLGFYGAGYLWLFGGCLIAGVVWGFRAMGLALGISLAVMTILGLGVHLGWFTWVQAVENATEKWVVLGINFLFLVALFTVAVSLLIRGMHHSLAKETEARKALEHERGRLRQSNLELTRQIDERVRAEKALSKSENRYREVLESISDAVLTHDLDGTITSINANAANALGYLAEDLIGQPGQRFLVPAQAKRFAEHYLPRIRRLGHDMGMLQVVATDGQVHFMEYRCSVVRPENDQPYVSGLARDVTRRIEDQQALELLQEQLNQARKMEALGTLAGGIAHDFNNILSAIIGYTEMSLENCADGNDEDNVMFLNRVLEASNRAKDLVRQILTFSRRRPGERSPKRLQPLVKDCLSMLQATIPASVNLETALDAPETVVECDATQIQQLVMNLCTNAAAAMEEQGGELRVELGLVDYDDEANFEGSNLPPGRYALLRVADQGGGIPPDIARRVFEPFFTTKSEGKGSGMGLAVVHGIVKAHEGGIRFETSPSGTTFEVALPLSRRPEVPAFENTMGEFGGKERLLFVDDEGPLVHIASTSLQKLGYRVDGFTSAQSALDHLRENPSAYDLLITDQTMPDLNGLQLATLAKELTPGLKVLLCTGYSTQITPEKLALAGVDELLLKPVGRQALAGAIRRLLDKPARA